MTSPFQFDEDDIEFALKQTREMLMRGVAHALNGGYNGPNLSVLVLTGPRANEVALAVSKAAQTLYDMCFGEPIERQNEFLTRPDKPDNPSRN